MRQVNNTHPFASRHHQSDDSHPTLIFNGSCFMRIELDDIVCIKSDGKKCYMCMTDGTELHIHCTLKDMEDELPHDMFVRVQRQYTVNIWKVVSIIGRQLVMCNQALIVMGKTYEHELMRHFHVIARFRSLP